MQNWKGKTGFVGLEQKMINIKTTSVVEEDGGIMGAVSVYFPTIFSAADISIFSTKMAGTQITDCLSLASLGSLQCA